MKRFYYYLALLIPFILASDHSGRLERHVRTVYDWQILTVWDAEHDNPDGTKGAWRAPECGDAWEINAPLDEASSVSN